MAVLVAGAATRLEGKHNTEGVFFSHPLVSWLHFCQNFTLWSEKYQKTVISCLIFEGKPHLSFLVFVFLSNNIPGKSFRTVSGFSFGNHFVLCASTSGWFEFEQCDS